MNIIKKAVFVIENKLKYRINKKEWRKRNPHNYTVVSNVFDLDKVHVGKGTYGGLLVHDFKNPEERLEIGNFCSIGPKSEFFLGGGHHPEFISNYPYKLYYNQDPREQLADRRCKGKIVLDDDVWIGANVIILAGVHIGQGAIVGAGSVVARDIPPYAVYAGNRIIRNRFSDETVEKLLRLDYNKLTEDYIKEKMDYFYTDNVEDAIAVFMQDGLISEK